MRRFVCGVGFAAALASAAEPARAGDYVLICYLFQSGSGTLSQFTRRLDVDLKARTVAIADDLNRTGFKPLGAYGRVVAADDEQLVFDYAAPGISGRTSVALRDGTLSYNDGRIVLRGNCTRS